MFKVKPEPPPFPEQTPLEHVAPAIQAAGVPDDGKFHPYPAAVHAPVDDE